MHQKESCPPYQTVRYILVIVDEIGLSFRIEPIEDIKIYIYISFIYPRQCL